MRWLTVTLLLAATLKAQEATRVGQHVLGESVQEWISRLDDPRTCKNHVKGQKPDKESCYETIASGKHDWVITWHNNRDTKWFFYSGKLDGFVISLPGKHTTKWPDVEQEVAFLVEAYGKPTSSEIVPYQNGYGARYEGAALLWEFPDGARLIAHIGVPPQFSSIRNLTITAYSAAAATRVADAGQNPYLTSK